jgi:DNA primase large subunit
MDAAEIADHYGPDAAIDEDAVARQVDRLVDERAGIQYLPPSCETMQAYGDCVNRDEVCATISHPLEYYEKRLSGADGGDGKAGDATDGGDQ